MSISTRIAACQDCYRIFGSANKRCTCGSERVIELTHEDGKLIASQKGKNKEKKQRKLLEEILPQYKKYQNEK